MTVTFWKKGAHVFRAAMKTRIGQSAWCKGCGVKTYHKVLETIRPKNRPIVYKSECSECGTNQDLGR